MTPDQITHLSGNLPIGIWLVPIAWGALFIIWFTVWWGTGFWGVRRLIVNFLIILVAVPVIYAVFWHLNPPRPQPIRIIAYANVDSTDKEAWRYEGCADIIRRNFEIAGSPYVVLDADYVPALWSYQFAGQGDIDSIAQRQTAHWLIAVSPNPSGISVKLTQVNKDKDTTFTQNSLTNYPSTAISIAGKVETAISGVSSGAIERLQAYVGTRPDEDYEAYYNAIKMRGAGEKDEAIATFKGLTKDTTWAAPRQQLVRTLLGYLTTYHRDSLYTTLISTLQNNERDPENYVLLGRYFMEFSMWEEAESALKLGMQVTKYEPRLYYYLARLNKDRIKNLEWSTRQELLERALYLAPGFENARMALADYHILRNAKLDAELILENGLDINPASRGLEMKAISNLIGRKKFAEAEVRLRPLMPQDEPDANMLYNLGIILLGEKRYDEAIVAFDSSFAVGWNADNIYYKALALQRAGKWDEAIHSFQRRMMLVKGQRDRVYYSSREWIKRIRKWQAEADSTGDSTKVMMEMEED